MEGKFPQREAMKVHVLTESDWKGRGSRVCVFTTANLPLAKARAKIVALMGDLAYLETVEIDDPKSVRLFKRELEEMTEYVTA
jgi:hypothetical protein